jgi:replicative DNA helicase
LIREQRDYEELFCAAVYGGAQDVALEKCLWLEESGFIDEELGSFWAAVKRTSGDVIRAANEVGIMPRLLGLNASRMPSFLFVAEYAERIAESQFLLSVVSDLPEIVRKANGRDISGVRDGLRSLAEKGVSASVRVATAAEVGAEFRQEIYSPSLSISSGLPSLDRELGRLFVGDMSILAARPGFGKTTFALQVARAAAMQKVPTAFFSLEMSRVQLWARAACPLAGYEWRDVRAGKVDKKGLDAIAQASEALERAYGKYLMIYDDVYTVADIHRVCTQIRPKLVVVDHLDEITWHVEADSEYIWYGKAAKYLRQYIAKSLKSHVLLVHQLSRKIEERKEREPVLSDLRGSGKLEQIGDVVMFIHRPDMYSNDPEAYTSTDLRAAQVFVRKNRQGPVNGVVSLVYNVKEQWFREPQVSPMQPT